jgi:hypothetical protein
VTDARIVETLSRYVSDPHGDACFRDILDLASERGLSEPWLPALRQAVPPAPGA